MESASLAQCCTGTRQRCTCVAWAPSIQPEKLLVPVRIILGVFLFIFCLLSARTCVCVSFFLNEKKIFPISFIRIIFKHHTHIITWVNDWNGFPTHFFCVLFLWVGNARLNLMDSLCMGCVFSSDFLSTYGTDICFFFLKEKKKNLFWPLSKIYTWKSGFPQFQQIT